jgi:D-alanyl-D-alanine carboxypeptidase
MPGIDGAENAACFSYSPRVRTEEVQMVRKIFTAPTFWRTGWLILSLTLLGLNIASAQTFELLTPDLPEYDLAYPSSHLVESWDLGDLGYSWREQLGVDGNERIWFKWFYEFSDAAQGDWVIRQMDGSVVASGTVVPSGPAPTETLWSVELTSLGAVTYPLKIQIEAIDGGGTPIVGSLTNEVSLDEYVPGPTPCFTDFGVGAPFTSKLTTIYNKWQVPALAAGIVTKGSGAQYDAVGWRKLASPFVSVTPADKWHIGSNTKAITAMLVGVLQQKASPLVQFSTTIGDVFPQSGFGTLAAHQATTIKMLLAHYGGIPAGNTVPESIWSNLTTPNISTTQQRRNFALDLLALPPITAPGTSSKYSNAGYIIVGAMLEEIYGSSWETLLDQELLGPGKLAMSDTGYGAPPPHNNSDQPWAHTATSGNLSLDPNKGDNPASLGPAGTIHTTLQNYGKYLRLLLNGSEAGVTLNPATLTELTTPWPGSNYGYGWGIFEEVVGPDTKTILNHAGSNGGWFFAAEVHLDDGYALVAVTNALQFWKPNLNTFHTLPLNQAGFFPHGTAAVNETFSMLSLHFLECPSSGISSSGWTTETGRINEGKTLAFLPGVFTQLNAVPALSLWGVLFLMGALGGLGVLIVARRRKAGQA